MKRSWGSILGVAAFVIALPVQAAVLNFFVNLNAANEGNPADTSTGTGNASLILDTIAQTLTGNIVFSGLTSPTTAAHIHCCLPSPFVPNTNVGVATVVPAFPGFPLGFTSGADHFVLQLNDASAYNPAFVTAQGSLANAEASFISGLETGRTYLNIHTMLNPGGEIRGFVVPEPMTASLILAGFAAAGLASRRRKRS